MFGICGGGGGGDRMQGRQGGAKLGVEHAQHRACQCACAGGECAGPRHAGSRDLHGHPRRRQDGHGHCLRPVRRLHAGQVRRDLRVAGPAIAVHIGPGTYHTKGGASFEVKSFWKIHGAGYEVTRIIQDLTGKIGCCVFCGRADGVEIEDLSVDCGFQNQQVVKGKIKANASAVGIGGNHLAVRRCWFKNYGSPYDQDTGENFAVFIGSADPDNGEDLIVEDCIFAGMSESAGWRPVGADPRGRPVQERPQGRQLGPRHHRPAKPLHRLPLRLPRHHHRRRCGAIATDNVLRAFHRRVLYQDTWPMRDFILADNLMIDVNQGIRLTCDCMNHFEIRGNTILVNDGYDIDKIVAGVVTTHIPHSLVVGNRVRIRTAKPADGKTMPDKDVFITSVPTRSSFTYSLTAAGKNETDTATGGFVQALDYQGCMCPAPEAIAISGSGNSIANPPTNFILDRNVIKPYSSDDTNRVPSSGIAAWGLKNGWVTNNIIFDSGNHADLVIGSPKGFTSSVICRTNYHPDGTRLEPRDGELKLIPGGLADVAKP